MPNLASLRLIGVAALLTLAATGCRKPQTPVLRSAAAPSTAPAGVVNPATAPVRSATPVAAPPGITTSAHDVRVDAGDVSVVTFLPLQKLGEAITKDHVRPQFRVAWSCDLDGPSRGTALYNRAAHTLDYTLTGARRQHLVFTGVTDQALLRLAKDYPGGGADAGFLLLPRYGCKAKKMT